MQTPDELLRSIEARLSALERTRFVLADAQAAGVIDHGGLVGLGDDDHTQYALANGTRGGGFDHGGLVGLGDDDHTQYFNTTRGDARYLQLAGGTVTGDLAVNGTTNLKATVQRNGTTARMLVAVAQASCTTQANPTSTTFIAVAGASLTLSLVSGDLVVVNTVFDMQCDGNGTVGVGSLAVGGTIQNELAVLTNVNPSTTSGVRATIAQDYTVTNTTTGNVVYDLRARCGAGFTTGVTVRTTHTRITAMVFR